MKIRAVVFDWAGTIVDFGSLAPMGAFVRLFENHGVVISIETARLPMGLPKLAHIQALGEIPEVAEQWVASKGREFGHDDALALLREFEPMSAASAMEHSDFIPGFLGTYDWLKRESVGVATTTGYTRNIMEPLISKAAAAGFLPSRVICCDDVQNSRPSPDGMRECMRTLDLEGQEHLVLKVDDTVPGILEGRNAGCWTVGVAASGNALGWTWEQWSSASESERGDALMVANRKLVDGGAHLTVPTVADLPSAFDMINAWMERGLRP